MSIIIYNILIKITNENDIDEKLPRENNTNVYTTITMSDQDTRLKNLTRWQLADFIFVLPENFSKSEDHRHLIEQIRPDFMAVSSHTSFKDKKENILQEFGAKLVVVHEFNPEFSSSKIIQNLNKKGCR